MTYSEKVDLVRNNIISNVQLYKKILAGHYYLYIFENRYFEMYYGTDNFLHLTGVGTNLSPNQFYQVAKKGQLQSSQLYFNSRFPLATALKKTNSLSELGKFVAEDEKEIYIPKSFRVKGNIFDKCDNSKMFEIQAILSKTDKEGLYDTVLYQEKDALHNLGEGIKKKIAI